MLSPDEKVIYAVGNVFLACQMVEHKFKLLVPLIAADSFEQMLELRARLRKDSLGGISTRFLESVSGDVEPLQKLVGEVVVRRNELAHHFIETHEAALAAGHHDAVLAHLAALRDQALELLAFLTQVGEAILQSVHASAPIGSRLHTGLDEMLETLRAKREAELS